MSRVSPIRTEYANASTSGLASAAPYFTPYTPYDTQHPSPPVHHSPSPPTTFVMSPQQGFAYPTASSPTHSMPPVSPVTNSYELQPTGLPGLPEEYIPQLHGSHQWNTQPTMAYGVGGPYIANSVGYANQPGLQMQQQDDSLYVLYLHNPAPVANY
ncbi:hypothetical protein EST38_g539 [Candolleomyces aberdarensis]|uniref:Uncharacterized protein n=1 Tax=Candolleomyces aberdarensis TaxID=2316362 RepID=A0A4Q2DZ20_9AGAR|nr:hypothetical protein EST38_g539 [Candolleomyces aberdarensis]